MSRRARTAVVAAALAVVSVGCAAAFAEPADDHPPHVAPPVAEASGSLPLAAVGGDSPAGVVAAVSTWIEGVERAEWFEGVRVAEEAARVEAARRAAVERVVAPRAGSASAECAAIAAEFGLPSWILERESGCGANNWNGGGCGGRGCVGPTQIDLGHFANPSPWGGVGACWGLDPNVWADLIECTNRLSGDGSNLAPWRN